MAVRLRLMRMGKKKQPTYRVVAADSRSPRNGRFIEIIGTYQPRLEPSVVKIDNDRAVHWLRHGAQPSEAVEKLLKISGAWAEFKGEEFVPSAAPAPKVKSSPKRSEPGSGEQESNVPTEENEEPNNDSDAVDAEVSEADSDVTDGVDAEVSEADSDVTDGADAEATDQPPEDEAAQDGNDDEERT